jgi:hypothetical protein
MDWLSPPTPTMCDESVTHTASHRVTSRDENVTARVTVCGLLDVWAAVNEAIDPTTLAVCGVRICDIDTIAGIPCFGRAMEAAGWAIHVSDPLGVIFPNFLEFNTPDAIRNSPLTGTERMRQKRARDREKTGVTNVTKCDVDKSRIEKSIDENTSTYFHLATNKSSQREDRNQRPKTEHAKTLGRALAAATKFEPMSKADHARLTRLGKVLADAAATEEEIAARAARFGRQWNVPITPEALVKHWGSLSGRQMRIETAGGCLVSYPADVIDMPPERVLRDYEHLWRICGCPRCRKELEHYGEIAKPIQLKCLDKTHRSDS